MCRFFGGGHCFRQVKACPCTGSFGADDLGVGNLHESPKGLHNHCGQCAHQETHKEYGMVKWCQGI